MLCKHGDSPQLLDLVLALVFYSLHELSSDLFANVTIIVFENHTGALLYEHSDSLISSLRTPKHVGRR